MARRQPSSTTTTVAVGKNQKGIGLQVSREKKYDGNHPSFYTHYDTSELIALNLAFKQNVRYPALLYTTGGDNHWLALPAVAVIQLQLSCPQGDLDGWKTGVRLLHQQLRTANSGRINYTVEDLEKYILNTRALHSICAWLKRLYKFTYTFRSTNSKFPENWIRGVQVDFNDIMTNAANLLMFQQRYIEQVKVAFPLKVDLFDRTHWLFENVFIDSNSDKPQFYVPNMMYATTVGGVSFNGIFYYVSQPSTTNSQNHTWQVRKTWEAPTNYWNFSAIMFWANKIKNDLLEDNVMSVIAGDIIKAFGDKAFFEMTPAHIDDVIEPLYDEDALNQFQNASCVGVIDLVNRVPNMDYGLHYYEAAVAWNNESSSNFLADTSDWLYPYLSIEHAVQTTMFGSNFFEKTELKYNQYLLNWHKNSISPGEVMSITRLIPSDLDMTSDATSINGFFRVWGTEIPVTVVAIADLGQDEFGPNQLSNVEYSIAGNIISNNIGPGELNEYQELSVIWAMFDWCPRMRFWVGDSAHAAAYSGVSGDIMDWDVFSLVRPDQISLYLSYGNQSLLYAARSQNQSNTEVYGKQTGGKPIKDHRSGKTNSNSNSNGYERDKQ